MSLTSDLMELREEDIQAHYAAALALLEGFDHTPRIGQARQGADLPARSSGIVRARRFRSTTPGMVTRSTQRPEGVRLLERRARDGRIQDVVRIEALDAAVERAGGLVALLAAVVLRHTH